MTGEAAAAIADGQSVFAALAERHRRELHVHCYRMLASFDDAEDAVQETFLRAWRGREGFESGSMFRAWLYRIATNVCLDMLRRSSHRARVMNSFAEVPWLQPYPDQLLDEAAPAGDRPDAAAIERETIELAFLAALQVLPPRQRAALVARDVLGWPASQTAAMLDISVAAAAIAAQDIRVTMPPYPFCYDGLAAIGPLLERALGPDRDGDWRLVPTRANRMPAAASYLRRPGDSQFRPSKLEVLRIEGAVIKEITTFGAGLFPAFGLPAVL